MLRFFAIPKISCFGNRRTTKYIFGKCVKAVVFGNFDFLLIQIGTLKISNDDGPKILITPKGIVNNNKLGLNVLN